MKGLTSATLLSDGELFLVKVYTGLAIRGPACHGHDVGRSLPLPQTGRPQARELDARLWQCEASLSLPSLS